LSETIVLALVVALDPSHSIRTCQRTRIGAIFSAEFNTGDSTMITMPAQDVKRRGISAVDDLLAREPVHIVTNNRPTYVVLSEEDYQTMMEDLALARIEASEADLKAGRVRRGRASDLMRELDHDE